MVYLYTCWISPLPPSRSPTLTDFTILYSDQFKIHRHTHTKHTTATHSDSRMAYKTYIYISKTCRPDVIYFNGAFSCVHIIETNKFEYNANFAMSIEYIYNMYNTLIRIYRPKHGLYVFYERIWTIIYNCLPLFLHIIAIDVVPFLCVSLCVCIQ